MNVNFMMKLDECVSVRNIIEMIYGLPGPDKVRSQLEYNIRIHAIIRSLPDIPYVAGTGEPKCVVAVFKSEANAGEHDPADVAAVDINRLSTAGEPEPEPQNVVALREHEPKNVVAAREPGTSNVDTICGPGLASLSGAIAEGSGAHTCQSKTITKQNVERDANQKPFILVVDNKICYYHAAGVVPYATIDVVGPGVSATEDGDDSEYDVISDQDEDDGTSSSDSDDDCCFEPAKHVNLSSNRDAYEDINPTLPMNVEMRRHYAPIYILSSSSSSTTTTTTSPESSFATTISFPESSFAPTSVSTHTSELIFFFFK